METIGKESFILVKVDGVTKAYLPQTCDWATFTDVISNLVTGTQKQIIINYDVTDDYTFREIYLYFKSVGPPSYINLTAIAFF